MKNNLNNVPPTGDFHHRGSMNFIDNSTQSCDGAICVYFRNLESKLIQHIRTADAIFGCIAWLTNRRILSEMAKKDTAIVFQKEDFLRPDTDQAGRDWKTSLQTSYAALSCSLERSCFGNIISQLCKNGDPSIPPVRCIGNHNLEKKPAFPRMHNKFLVFARITRNLRQFETTEFYEQYWQEDSRYTDLKEKGWSSIATYADRSGVQIERSTGLDPYAVWTGSFNFTENANCSLENALYLTSPEIVRAYYSEFGQIMALSEPLDWESEWVAPEWRIGS